MSHTYTREEINFITENTPGHSYREIVELFYKQFGIQLSSGQINSFVGNHKLNTGRTVRFEKGHIPANKGTHNGGWEPTQWKKGHRPHNYRPVGSERVNGDGYVDIKIADPKNWRGKHVLIWEKENGPILKGHAVIFGDGDRRNFGIDNLILVSRKQLVRLNQKRLIQKDANLTRTGIIIADLCNMIGEKKSKSRGNRIERKCGVV